MVTTSPRAARPALRPGHAPALPPPLPLVPPEQRRVHLSFSTLSAARRMALCSGSHAWPAHRRTETLALLVSRGLLVLIETTMRLVVPWSTGPLRGCCSCAAWKRSKRRVACSRSRPTTGLDRHAPEMFRQANSTGVADGGRAAIL